MSSSLNKDIIIIIIINKMYHNESTTLERSVMNY